LRFDGSRHHLIVAIVGDLVVGMVSAVDYLHPDKPPQLWINEIGVASSYRSRGIGRRMLSAMLDHARTLGCVEAWLLTDDDNLAANKLYRSLRGVADPQVMYEFDLTAETGDVPNL
jgi:ribosomal protein S18 acetylase RimI-like enzyme